LKPILKNLSIAIQHQQNLVVRIPVIPGYNDGLENAEAFVKLFNKMNITEVELLPFHQFGEKKYASLDRDYQMQDIPQLHTEDLDYFKEILEAQQIQCKVQ
ncbi:MAG: glycyl-radical enzyme activating protein, partial [Enterococcus sp.]